MYNRKRCGNLKVIYKRLSAKFNINFTFRVIFNTSRNYTFGQPQNDRYFELKH